MDPIPTLPPRLTTVGPLLWGTVLVVVSGTVLLCPSRTQAQDEGPSTRIEFLKYGSMATNVEQSPDGRHIAIGARDVPRGGSRVVLWNRVRQERARVKTYPANQAPKVAFDSTGGRLVVAPAQSEPTIWHLESTHTETPRGPTTAANDVAFGLGGTLGVGGSVGPAGRIGVWHYGTEHEPTVLETDGPVRSIAFSETTSDVVFTSDATQVTLWNYRLNTTKHINTFERCEGVLRQVEMTDRSNVYLITERRADCDPDYLCWLNPENGRVLDRFQRKNISHVEPLSGRRVAYSRGRYVYTLNLQTKEERIVFHSDNAIQDLSYARNRLVVANSDVVVLEL